MNRNKTSLLDWCKNNDMEYIIDEWDKQENELLNFNIEEISFRSNKYVNWKCSKGHKWKLSPDNRTKGSKCPYCSGRKVLQGYNDISTTHPELVLDWDYEKNELKPNQVTDITNKKVFWKCHKCGNKWSTLIKSRAVKGTGCPKCAAKQRGESRHINELKRRGHFNDKKLLLDWDWEENKPNTPADYTPSSNSYVKWKCHVCGYKWSAKISNRVNGRGCPCCSNKVVVKGINDLATKKPELAKEWHPTKNGNLKPDMVTPGMGKKVYWLCPKGHQYEATILHRSSGTNCPICNLGRQTSFAEQAVFYYVKKEFPDAINKYKPSFLKRMELDIFIPSRNTAIEYDGAAWHSNTKLKRDQTKYALCRKNGIKLIRIRESFPALGSDIADYMFGNNLRLYEYDNLNLVIIDLLKFLSFKSVLQITREIDVNTKRDEKEIRKYITTVKGSLLEKCPDIAKDWDYVENGFLTPDKVFPGSDQKVAWIWPNCGKKYVASISHRTNGTGCPDCALLKVISKTSKKVIMIEPQNNETIKTYDSISEAGRDNGISSSNITMVCKGIRKRAGGYIWKYYKKSR